MPENFSVCGLSLVWFRTPIALTPFHFNFSAQSYFVFLVLFLFGYSELDVSKPARTIKETFTMTNILLERKEPPPVWVYKA